MKGREDTPTPAEMRHEIEVAYRHLLRMIDSLLDALPSEETLRRERAEQLRAMIQAEAEARVQQLRREKGGHA